MGLRAPEPRTFAVLLAVAGCIAIGYGAALDAYFLADDFTLIAGISRGADDGPRWSLALTHWVSGHHFESFRPLVTLAQLCIYSLAGARPIPFRLLNLLLHGLVAFQVYRLAERIARQRLAAGLAALLFATHPLIVEGVTYIASLAGLLCAVFMFSALVSAVDYVHNAGSGRLASMLALTLLAFASKEEALAIPIATAIVCLAVVLDAPTWPCVQRAIVAFAGIALVTMLYLAHKRTIFGHFFPAYFGDLTNIAGSMAGLANIARRFLHPVNYLVASHGPRLALGYGALVGLICLFGVFQIRRRWRDFVVCAFLFGAFASAGARFFSEGFDAGLTNGRLVYSAAAAVALVCAIICSAPGTRRLIAVRLFLGCSLILLQLGLTIYNNRAWAEAGILSRTIQAQSLKLTGNDVTAPVYNVPDTYKGVFIDRGGWSRARLAPFIPGNRYGVRTRVVTVHNNSDHPLRLALRPPDGDVRANGVERPLSAGERRVVSLSYRPTGSADLTAQLDATTEGVWPSGPVPIATLRGRSAVIDPRDLWLSAEILNPPPGRDPGGGAEVILGVVAPKGELPPAQVTVGVTPGAPWRHTVFLLGPKGEVPLPSGTVTFASGQGRLFRIVLTPTSDRPWPRVRLSVHGPNVPEVKALEPDLTVEMDPTAVFPEPNRHGSPTESLRTITVGPNWPPLPGVVDFGAVPLHPTELRTGDSFASWMQSSAEPLFWDDLAQRVRRLSEIDAMPAIFQLGGEQLARTSASSGARQTVIEPGVLAYWDIRHAPLFRFDGLDISPADVSWLSIEMRVAYASTFYGAVGWTTSLDKGEAGQKGFLSLPDGRWRTYFVRLDDIALPADLRIRGLWIKPVLSGGYVEIRNIRLLRKPLQHIVRRSKYHAGRFSLHARLASPISGEAMQSAWARSSSSISARIGVEGLV